MENAECCGLPRQHQCRRCKRQGFNPWVGNIPWRREQLPTPVFWPGEFHGLYSLWGRKELDMTFTSLPVNIQGWFRLGLTGSISLQFKGLQRVFSPQFKSIVSLVLSFPYGPTLTSLRDYWKNSFDYMHLCQQSDICFIMHCLGLSSLSFQGAS